MHESSPSLLYEISLNIRVAWYAQSLSNAGNNGSNRLLPRRQLLAGGTETDACSGNIAKHFHAVLLAEYLEAAGCPLCPARPTKCAMSC
jgi:CRISPR/Cas system-associated protein Cas7 (RAMP superfamily)